MSPRIRKGRGWERLAAMAWGVLSLALGCSETDKTSQPSTNQSGGAGGESSGSSAGGARSNAGGQAGTGVGASAGGAAGAGGGPVGAGGGQGGAPGVEAGAKGSLTIYWIDVEGGASTILVAPNGQIVVVDAGFPGARDPARIAKVLKDEVHAETIDHLVNTHYHVDHVGGIPTLAGMIPVSHFYDHGTVVEPSANFDNYVTAAGAKRMTRKPGDKIVLGDLEITFVTGAGEVIDPPLPTAMPNATCPSTITKTMNGGEENPMSLGFVAQFGIFTFVDLGDLTWAIEQKLMCPTNRIGTVDLYQVNHHGMDISNSPQLVHALAPTVAVMDNGATKGGSPGAFDVIKASPGLADLWSLHHVTANDALHNADDALTANLDGPDSAYWIKAVVEANGAYTITNARNGTSRTYASR
jgi:competence protein ComEC